MDEVIQSLEKRGVATFVVPEDIANCHQECFHAALQALQISSTISSDDPLRISAAADSASASGVHGVGALSQYNMCREGVVFSNGDVIDMPLRSTSDSSEQTRSPELGKHGPHSAAGMDCNVQETDAGSLQGEDGGRQGTTESQRKGNGGSEPGRSESFADVMKRFQDSLHRQANEVLGGIERRLRLETGWFEAHLGPFRDHSQWHVKRYRPDTSPPQAKTADGKQVLLQLHSDPSLISIVVIDRPGLNAGSVGLECQGRMAGEFAQVERHGHRVVTVLVGSLLDRITGGMFPAARHRVALRPEEVEKLKAGPCRVAATLFLRPAPDALLRKPPSPDLGQARVPEMRFSAWQLKTQKRYEKHAPPRPASVHTQKGGGGDQDEEGGRED